VFAGSVDFGFTCGEETLAGAPFSEEPFVFAGSVDFGSACREEALAGAPFSEELFVVAGSVDFGTARREEPFVFAGSVEPQDVKTNSATNTAPVRIVKNRFIVNSFMKDRLLRL
jgi:hypothetical protein